MHANYFIKFFIFFGFLVLLLFAIRGCENRVLNYHLSKELEALAGVHFATFELIDSSTSKTETFRHNRTFIAQKNDKIFQKEIDASKLMNMSSVMVQRALITDSQYQFCNFVHINGITRLICKNNTDQIEHDQLEGVPSLPPRIAIQLETLDKNINNIGFLILPGLKDGETKLFINRSKGYTELPLDLSNSSQPIEKLKKSMMFGYTNYAVNPCHQRKDNGDGTFEDVWRLDIDC